MAERAVSHLVVSSHPQPAPAEPSWHEQTLLLIGGCHPSGPCPAGPLLPVELAWIPEQRPATTPAREPCLMLQMPPPPALGARWGCGRPAAPGDSSGTAPDPAGAGRRAPAGSQSRRTALLAAPPDTEP